MAPTVGKPIVCIDFDGVCHKHIQQWTNIATVADGPTEGLADWLKETSREARIALFTARFRQGLGRQAVIDWWDLWQLPHVEMWTAKPPAIVSIDDRALTFTGDWKDFPTERLLSFKPWNRK